ncbi:murein hydrolase activator EnvC family protein [Curtobacterium ammoniigenes]|uniref:murein hydrolase activator EnvC family protein n=1 Tax=Curtobacterium ammoniigenes TaxID=395387 RepID=UPI00082B4ACE|nr:peptidoglycan DD-metalloendopeptidase family protein [Curtobacterium ammoniigenes]
MIVLAALITLCPAPVATVGAQAAVSSRLVPRPSWSWPVAAREMARGWEAPAHDFGAGHRGVDFRVRIGEPVRAPDSGTVSFAGPVAGRPVVVIEHVGGLRSTIDAADPEVRAGQRVARGQLIGTARGDHCAGREACLHLGARIGEQYVDPTPYLLAQSWPILLPLT